MEAMINDSSSWKLLADGKCIKMEGITADFASKNKRQLCPPIDGIMEKIWREKLHENKRLYNMSKFRLQSVNVDSGIHLNIGLTDYRETICTNHLPNIEEIRNFGINNYNDPNACFGDAIGVGGVVITNDDFLVLIKRSDWVAESKGCYDTPGGHAEPEEMLKKLDMTSSDLVNVKSSDVIYELFHSFVREVRDEVNIPESSISWPLLLGVTRNKLYGEKPGLLFYTKCNLIKEEVEKLYLRGGAETDESTELKFISVKELLVDHSFVLGSNVAPLGQLALLLFLHNYPIPENL